MCVHVVPWSLNSRSLRLSLSPSDVRIPRTDFSSSKTRLDSSRSWRWRSCSHGDSMSTAPLHSVSESESETYASSSWPRKATLWIPAITSKFIVYEYRCISANNNTEILAVCFASFHKLHLWNSVDDNQALYLQTISKWTRFRQKWCLFVMPEVYGFYGSMRNKICTQQRKERRFKKKNLVKMYVKFWL